MATSSFTKNFKISGKKSESFIRVMSSRPKQSIDKRFESKRTKVSDRKELLGRALG